MTKRLQVLLDEPEWREVQRAAKAERTTVAEWVRKALRAARRARSSADVDARLAAIRTAAAHQFSFGRRGTDERRDRTMLPGDGAAMIVDANVPMVLIGADHPNKTATLRMLERAAANHERLVTDRAVFQEILHRYVAIARRDAIQPAFDALNAVVDDVFTIEARVVERAKDVVLGYNRRA